MLFLFGNGIIPFLVKNDNNSPGGGAALAAMYLGFAAKAAPTIIAVSSEKWN